MRSPESAARAMLAGMLAPVESGLPRETVPDWLLPHQADAVLRARAILARFGGVLIADGVGLGKTFTGLALAALERERGGGAVAFVPASLVGEWQAAARKVGVPLALYSHTSLARSSPALPERCSLLVVDEAHAFRNPRTARYDALARLAAGRRVALLSATPLNNTPADLAALIHLFAPRDRFREFGVADIGDTLDNGDSAGSLALSAISVCRTRRLVEERFPGLRASFPRRRTAAPTCYDLDACYGNALPAMLDALREIAQTAADASRGAALLHLGLLRRLESSRAALRRTLARHRDVLDEIARAAEQGVDVARADVRASWREDGDESQLALWPLLIGGTDGARAGVAQPRAAVQRALDLADSLTDEPDSKLAALEELLRGPLCGRRTVVFTEYRDTAMYLLRRLRSSHRVICIVGNAAFAGSTILSRDEALDAFAPLARGRRPSPLLEADLLVATDVLSEGLNLQDANAVVSYDLPWNPVRVMQRIGRIERLGSPHAAIDVAHLAPQGGLRELTTVLATLRRKLEATSHAIGAEPDPLASLWWLDDGPRGDTLERECWRRVAPFEARERWRAVAGAATAEPRAPIVAAALAQDELPAAVGVLLALEWKGAARVPLPFVIEHGKPPRRDAQALGDLAMRAMNGAPVLSEPGLFTSALAAVLPEARACLVALSASRRGAPQPGPGRREALELLTRGAAHAHRHRAEDEAFAAAIDLLARDLASGYDRLLARLVKEGGSPVELARRIRELLASPPAAPSLIGTPRLALVAALAVTTHCPSS